MTKTQQPELPALLPCPFCGAGEHQIRENGRMWSGMRFTEPASVTVHHWCEKPDGQPQSVVTITGRDEASAIGLWNARAKAAVLADRESRKPWFFKQMAPSNTILAVEPDGTEHVVKSGHGAAFDALFNRMIEALSAPSKAEGNG